MTTPTPSREYWEKARIESELSVFFDCISKNLPKSIERVALGDEKIFRAFRAAYQEIRSYLLKSHNDALVAEIEKMRKEISEPIYEYEYGPVTWTHSYTTQIKPDELLDQVIRIIQKK